MTLTPGDNDASSHESVPAKVPRVDPSRGLEDRQEDPGPEPEAVLD